MSSEHDKNNNVSRFFKNGKSRLPFSHGDHYPANWERAIIRLKNKVFDQLYPVRPWLFASIWSASSAYLYLNGERVPVFLTKSPYSYVIGGFAVASIPVLALRSILHLFLFRYKRHMFEERKSLLSKLFGICYVVWKKLAPKPGLLTCESLLPRQSVPPLKQTIKSYLDSLEPLLSESDFAHLKQLANEFEANQGRKLQRYAWLYSLWVKNYICGFWEKYVYLSSRDNLLINSSICSGETLKPPAGATQATRAGHCAYLTTISMLRYAARQQAPLFEGFMCSNHYTRLYASCRVPGKDMDHWTLNEYSRHLVVIRNGCFYKLDCFDPKTNKLYSILDFVQLMDDILKRNDKPTETESRVAALTLDNRDTWAKNRQRFFLENPTNRKFIETIESAIVVFVLDDSDYGYNPENSKTVVNLYSNMMVGDGTNRWVDKSIHYMFGSNASCGAFTEHSVADGAEFVVAMEEVLGVDAVYLNYPELSASDLRPRDGLRVAQRMDIEIFNEMPAEIERCFSNFQVMRDNNDFASLVIMDWGKGRIKKTNCSPDAFMQMAIQLAYYRDQGEFTSTYEAAAARFFQLTRTETIRTVSNKSCAFVEAMQQENRDVMECGRLLREACAQHQLKSKLAMTGGGFDRHLFVLYVLSKYFKVESPFLAQYVKQQWKLSTSQSPLVTNIMKEDLNPINLEQCYYGGAFCAVHKEGYGVCYRFIGNHGMVAHISSYHSASNTSSARFEEQLEKALDEMISLFE